MPIHDWTRVSAGTFHAFHLGWIAEKQGSLDSFVDKAVGALNANYHLLLMDLFPPRPFDPTGIHGAIWQRLGGSYEPPAGKPLTLAGYAAEGTVTSVLRRWKRVIDGVA